MNSFVITGLGNPGRAYKKTPHNAGRSAVVYLAGVFGVNKWRFDRDAQCWRADIISEEGKLSFVLPENYMNRSGEVLKSVFEKEGWAREFEGEKLIVVYDDIDIVMGRLKISFDGSSGGHNGVQNIIDEMGTKNFIRLRIGVSPKGRGGEIDKPEGDEVTSFLLAPLNVFDRGKLRKVFPKVKYTISTILRDGFEKAMNEFN